jgi:hypothetical protein
MSDVKPALTEQEWATKSVMRGEQYGLDGFEAWIDPVLGLMVSNFGSEDQSSHKDPAHLHIIAALALYGQPFGFEHHHVSWLREEAAILERAGAGAGALVCNEIADRIEALLPPSDSTRAQDE